MIISRQICNFYEPQKCNKCTHIPGNDLDGHLLLPMHLCGILQSSVYGQMGGSEIGAGSELSYTNPNSFIIKNCRFQPSLRNGTRKPRISSILTPPNLFMMLACPTISSNQSSIVAFFSHHDSGCLCVMECTAISWPWLANLWTIAQLVYSWDTKNVACICKIY